MYRQSHEYTSVCDVFYDCGFHQTVTSPTRLDNILDLVLGNNSLIVNKLTVTCPLGNSDHNKVEFELISAIPREADDDVFIPTVKYDFTKANWVVLKEYLMLLTGIVFCLVLCRRTTCGVYLKIFYGKPSNPLFQQNQFAVICKPMKMHYPFYK